MIRIDDSLLEEIGLISLPKPDRDQMLRQIYETLEMRVGMRLAERMTDQQLDEFERFIDTNDEAGALKWLETNFPDYKQVVADELDKLKVEIKKDSAQILATMQQQSTQVAESAPLPPIPAPVSEYPSSAAPQPEFTQPTQQPVQPMAPQPWSVPAEPIAQLQQPAFQAPAPSPQPFTQPTQPAVADPAVAQPLTPATDNASSAAPQQDDGADQAQTSGPSIPPPPTF